MPELPEVETVRRGLAPVMEGALITRAEVRRADLRFPFPPDFARRIENRRILALSRRAKYLLIELDNDDVVIAHLGMSGSFRVVEAASTDADTPGDFHHPRGKDERHDHVVFHLLSERGPVQVIYNDPRRFGFMDIGPRETLAAHAFFRQLGEEPTGNRLDAAYLAGRFAGKAQPLKSTLLDQRVIAGLGNIYVCEALWRARLSPLKASGKLVDAKGRPRAPLVVLTEAIRAVIADAIAAGGSSLRDHIQTDGSLGYFQHTFAVYDREGKPCARPGCGGTIARIPQAGRSTFHCASCQV
ncbi:DNA-(apurinic or apyrimidinic site) lyase [Rhizobium sp. PP-CC-3A-592]|nr:DNA-(apurinic or apyrimidinic site) lyase [Rhizobium sp. PP-CC-3A-592]